MRCTSPVNIQLKNNDVPMVVPCGKCISCRIGKSREWSVRGLHELSSHDCSCFLTLTYDEENVPLSVNPYVLQKFIKRLRKHVGRTGLKYFACGEYGDKSGRPHYHLIIFGWRPGAFSKHGRYFSSSEVSDLWPFGFNTVGSVTYDSIRYVTDYVFKRKSGPEAVEELLSGRLQPFVLCSKGIGRQWAEANASGLQATGELTVGGVKQAIPRYYLKHLGLDSTDLPNYDEKVAKRLEDEDLLINRDTSDIVERDLWTLERMKHEVRLQRDLNEKARTALKEKKL